MNVKAFMTVPQEALMWRYRVHVSDGLYTVTIRLLPSGRITIRQESPSERIDYLFRNEAHYCQQTGYKSLQQGINTVAAVYAESEARHTANLKAVGIPSA